MKPSHVCIKYHELGLEINGQKISKCVFTVPLPECEKQLFSGWQYVSDNMAADADHFTHHLHTKMLDHYLAPSPKQRLRFCALTILYELQLLDF